FWFTHHIRSYPYVYASLLANLISISVAFFGYKWFVFRTKGNYLKEWLRCIGVYSGGIILSTAALPPLVGLLRHATQYQKSAPYIAGALVMGVTVILSFFGHKHFSFKSVQQEVEEGSVVTAKPPRND
ncbi:MAG TPA: GtrA family protein, partial [Acidobacteriaceae bacterium]|nr:GtrA family protein [Acidobacteriaceae bacterium]